MTVDTFADRQSAHYQERVVKVIVGLRDLADRVEREGSRVTNKVSLPGHGWAAHKVLHEVTWGFANLNLDGLVLAACEADEAARVEASNPATV